MMPPAGEKLEAIAHLDLGFRFRQNAPAAGDHCIGGKNESLPLLRRNDMKFLQISFSSASRRGEDEARMNL
jgi:hypothetical protein